MYHTLVVQCINYSTTIDMARTEVGIPGWERECSACYMYLRLTRRRYNIVGVRLSEVTRGGSAAVQCSTDCDIATRKLMYAAICPTQPAECSTHELIISFILKLEARTMSWVKHSSYNRD